jgi:hypothetical protein
MISIDNALVSLDVFEKKFVCDLNACKGECCVAGDSGAPLEKEELEILETVLPEVLPYMNSKGKKAVEKNGVYEIDGDGDFTTTLVAPGKECAFVVFDENKIAGCAIEKAFLDRKIKWQKPISCHLYPIRISYHKNYEAVNFHSWNVCKPACSCGEKLNVPVYKFLKAPLIRKYGKSWYKTLELVAKEYSESKK